MKELQHLNKYFSKYKWRILVGLIITILSKILALKVPQVIGNTLNVVEDYQKAKATNLSEEALQILLEEVQYQLFVNILIIIGVAVLAGFFTCFLDDRLEVMLSVDCPYMSFYRTVKW